MFIEDIYERYLIARWSYLMGQPVIPDDIEYDRLEKEFKEKYPEDIHSKQTWAFDTCPAELLNKYNLSSLICNPTMGYMAESMYSINSEEELEGTLISLNERSRLSYKIDGWNTRVSYLNKHLVKVESRGRSGRSIDMTKIHKLFPSTIPYEGRVAVTGELSISNRDWNMYKLITGNSDQRASVSTALANVDIEYLSYTAFDIFIEDNINVNDKYVLLKELGFKTPFSIFINNYKELMSGIKYLSSMYKGYPYLADGLVLENTKFQYAIRVVAWQEQSLSSYVEGYEESQGMYGVSMVVLIHPIIVEGKKCSRVNITNIAGIVENKLEINSPIVFNRRSAANSVIDSSSTRSLQNKWKGRYKEYCEMINNNY